MADDALVGNAGDKEQVHNARRKEKLQRERDKIDLRFILGDRRGRRFFWRYLRVCRVFQVAYQPGSPSPTAGTDVYFREGQRSIGLTMLADVNDADPEAYGKMMAEAKEEEANG